MGTWLDKSKVVPADQMNREFNRDRSAMKVKKATAELSAAQDEVNALIEKNTAHKLAAKNTDSWGTRYDKTHGK